MAASAARRHDGGSAPAAPELLAFRLRGRGRPGLLDSEESGGEQRDNASGSDDDDEHGLVHSSTDSGSTRAPAPSKEPVFDTRASSKAGPFEARRGSKVSPGLALFQRTVRKIIREQRKKAENGVTVRAVAMRAKNRFKTAVLNLECSEERNFIGSVLRALPVLLKETAWMHEIGAAVDELQTGGDQAEAMKAISKVLHDLKLVTARFCWAQHIGPIQHEKNQLEDHHRALKEKFNKMREQYLEEITTLRNQLNARVDPDKQLAEGDRTLFYDPVVSLSEDELAYVTKVVKEKLTMILDSAKTGEMTNLSQVMQMQGQVEQKQMKEILGEVEKRDNEIRELKEKLRDISQCGGVRIIEKGGRGNDMVNMLESKVEHLRGLLKAKAPHAEELEALKQEKAKLDVSYAKEQSARKFLEEKVRELREALERKEERAEAESVPAPPRSPETSPRPGGVPRHALMRSMRLNAEVAAAAVSEAAARSGPTVGESCPAGTEETTGPAESIIHGSFPKGRRLSNSKAGRFLSNTSNSGREPAQGLQRRPSASGFDGVGMGATLSIGSNKGAGESSHVRSQASVLAYLNGGAHPEGRKSCSHDMVARLLRDDQMGSSERAADHVLFANYTKKLNKEKEALQASLDEALEQIRELQAQKQQQQAEAEAQKAQRDSQASEASAGAGRLDTPSAPSSPCMALSPRGLRSPGGVVPASPTPSAPEGGREQLGRRLEENKDRLRRLSQQQDDIALALRAMQERSSTGDLTSASSTRVPTPSAEEVKILSEMQQLGREQDFEMFLAQVEIAVAEWAQQVSDPDTVPATPSTAAGAVATGDFANETAVGLMETVKEHCQALLTKVNDTAMFGAEMQTSVAGLKKQTLATVEKLRSTELVSKDPSLMEAVASLEKEARAQGDVVKRLTSLFLSARKQQKIDEVTKERLQRILPLLKLDDTPPTTASADNLTVTHAYSSSGRPSMVPVPPSSAKKNGRTFFPLNDEKRDLPSVSGVAAQVPNRDEPLSVGKPGPAKAQGQLRKARLGPVRGVATPRAPSVGLADSIELGGTSWTRGVTAPPEVGYDLSPMPGIGGLGGEDGLCPLTARAHASGVASRRPNFGCGATTSLANEAAPTRSFGASVFDHNRQFSKCSGEFVDERTHSGLTTGRSTHRSTKGSTDSLADAALETGEAPSSGHSKSPTRGFHHDGSDLSRMPSRGLSTRFGDCVDAADLPSLKATKPPIIGKKSSNAFALMGGAVPALEASPAPAPTPTPRGRDSKGRAGGELPEIEALKVVKRSATGR